MIGRILSRLLFWAIKNKQFTSKETACLAMAALERTDLLLADRSLCTSALLKGLYTLPVDSIINVNEQGVLHINSREVDPEKITQLRAGAKSILNSSTRRLVNEQVKYAAIEMIVHKGLTPEQSFFGKAAIWILEQEDSLYQQILGGE